MVRSILKGRKINTLLKKNLLQPTKIYSKEILKLINKNYIHSAAHITGGGLIENLMRSIPDNLSVEIDLSRIKILKIFKWIKKSGISGKMLKTFNCGVSLYYCTKRKSKIYKQSFLKQI